jgi:peroxiredoxin
MEQTSMKPVSGAPMPAFKTPKVGGGELMVGTSDTWQLVYVYRGKHCPLCRKFLTELSSKLDDFTLLGVDVAVVSADNGEKAGSEAAEEGWRFPVGYDLSVNQMRQLGLYISEPRDADETDRPFAEPAMFILNPKRQMHIISIANSPAVRPSIATLLASLKFTMEKNLPPRGRM